MGRQRSSLRGVRELELGQREETRRNEGGSATEVTSCVFFCISSLNHFLHFKILSMQCSNFLQQIKHHQ